MHDGTLYRMTSPTTTDSPTLTGITTRRRDTVITHAEVLAIFTQHGALTANEVSDITSIRPSTIRRYANDLRDAGYLGTGFSPNANATTYFVTPRDDSK